MWDKILEKFYPEITYVFCAEEPECGLYINTDVDNVYLL